MFRNLYTLVYLIPLWNNTVQREREGGRGEGERREGGREGGREVKKKSTKSEILRDIYIILSIVRTHVFYACTNYKTNWSCANTALMSGLLTGSSLIHRLMSPASPDEDIPLIWTDRLSESGNWPLATSISNTPKLYTSIFGVC